jgi:Kef-type K+ transport system membrane component KefB/nucleotide-binding universal stress UspA family protein
MLRHGGRLLAILAGLAWFTTTALGAEQGASAPAGNAEALLLAQVLVLVLLGRLIGELMYRIGQPSIIGQILAGVLLGPTVFGSLWPAAQQFLFPPAPEQTAMLAGLSQLGILFLLLLAGMETDLGLAWRLRKAALSVSLAGIAVPFALGFLLGLLMPGNLLPEDSRRLVTALFLGTALSISSLKIVATVVREMNFMRRNVGQLIVASAVIDDTAGWVIIGITLSIATAGTLDPMMLGITVLGTLLFLGVSFTIGRRIVFEVIRWTNDSLHSDLPVVTAIIGIMGILALITAGIGVQTVLGAFVAGVLIGQSPILTRQIDEQLRGLTTALFMPVFFGLTGLHADLRVLADPETLALVVGLILIASLGKFGGAFIGAKLNGMSFREALALGFGMNARGSTEVIVASIGLSIGVLDQRLFSVIVTMAIVTTLIMPPTLRWALARLPILEDEQQRLDREEFEEDSFVSKLERILLVVDPSAAGRLASLLAGHLGGLRNMPVTVLNLASTDSSADAEEAAPKPKPKRRLAAKPRNGTRSKAARATRPPSRSTPATEDPPAPAPTTDAAEAKASADRVQQSASTGVATAKQDDATRENDIHVETRIESDDLADTLAAEADKGHDLLYVGVEPLIADAGGFEARVETMLTAFRRTAAIVSARGELRRDPDAQLRILVPVSGDAWSMRAVEFAVMLAKANGARVAALYVRADRPLQQSRRLRGEAAPSHRAIFEHAKEIGKHYEIDVRTILKDGMDPEDAILSQARRGRHNLIILGVGRRAGERLSFGATAAILLETSDRSLVFFASG